MKRHTKSISPDSRRSLPAVNVGNVHSQTARATYLLPLRRGLDLRARGPGFSKYYGVIWGHSFRYPLAYEV